MAQAMPSSASLPSDYALISRYAAARGSPEAARTQDDEGGNTFSSPTTARTHALSIGRPTPAMPPGQQHSEVTNKPNEPEWPMRTLPEDEEALALATETTPLIPNCGGNGYNQSEDSDWRQELKILGRYTTPVFV
jgi:hypothetical protein